MVPPPFKADLQDSNSSLDIALDKVGIVDLEKKVEIVQENKSYSFYPKISSGSIQKANI